MKPVMEMPYSDTAHHFDNGFRRIWGKPAIESRTPIRDCPICFSRESVPKAVPVELLSLLTVRLAPIQRKPGTDELRRPSDIRARHRRPARHPIDRFCQLRPGRGSRGVLAGGNHVWRRVGLRGLAAGGLLGCSRLVAPHWLLQAVWRPRTP